MAVHNAAIAGYEDTVRVILGADSMVDLNTPTFQTKETLAHLAVKNGHKNMFNILQAFGADLRIKDANGRSLSDVASDTGWAREIAARTAEYFAKIPGDARRSDLILPPRTVHGSVSAQRQSVNESSTTTTALGKSNKTKGKRGIKGAPKEETMIVAAAVAADSAIDTKRVLMRLLQSAGFEINESMESECPAVVEGKLRKLTMACFTRLRDASNSADDKADDVHNACELMKDMEDLVASYSKPSSLNAARFHFRVVVCSEAVHVIHMMQKLNRVDHAAIAVPAITSVLELCNTSAAYAEFVIGTAKLCVSVDRKSQAREILDVLEKRLLKIPFAERKPSEYRDLVQAYSTARDSMGLGQTSSRKTFGRLEWYLTNTMEQYELLLGLDRVAGRPFYFECRLTAEASDLDVARLMFGISIVPDLEDVVVFGTDRRVIYAGASKADVASTREILFTVAHHANIVLDDRSVQSCTTSIHFGDFVFLNNGILRNVSAA
ncbi:hypothetical protein PHYPSEUDO_011082 [Phytophthora pseudosyringae]|uniref:Uncharacterized protein n=1 Tax=Phytophthora pseudosyringae TaxID=221518 RepID=A0A8T1WA54_9STRA|nr:hypothetical protein PHYPSEUDO_011082 [Phytophthora pseudosyringae]